MALEICYNAKVQRPGVCNAVETILVDEAIAHAFLPELAERLGRAGVELRGDERARAVRAGAASRRPKRTSHAEFLDLDLRGRRGRRHRRRRPAHRALRLVAHRSDRHRGPPTRRAASSTRSISRRVVVNASTRFADGGELGPRRRDRHLHHPPPRLRPDGRGGAHDDQVRGHLAKDKCELSENARWRLKTSMRSRELAMAAMEAALERRRSSQFSST